MNCPLCGETLAERGFFCKACAAQVRCKNCRELLEPAALACVECGTRVGQPGAENPGDGASLVATSAQSYRNTLSYQETRNDRTFHASVTDSAIDGLGEVLGEFFAQRGEREQFDVSFLVLTNVLRDPMGSSPGPVARNSLRRPHISSCLHV